MRGHRTVRALDHRFVRIVRRSAWIVAFLALVSTTDASAQDPAPDMAADTSFIEVSGFGQISLPSDRARISFIVETEGENAQEAAEKNADLMDQVITALRSSGIAELEIETFGYNLYPRYARPRAGEPQRIEGYSATNNVRVTTLEMDGVGSVIDLAVGAGANRVSSLSFDVRNAEAARLEALATAVRQARAQAEVIAMALGGTLGAPLEVRGGAQAPSPIYSRTAMSFDMAEAAPTPIEPGQQTVSANVTIRFRLVTH